MSILKKKNLIIVDSDSHIFLTDEGKIIAEKIYERHVTIKEYLIRLGVSNKVADADACKIEHVLSDETFMAIKIHAESVSKK